MIFNNIILYPVQYVVEKCRICLEWVVRVVRMMFKPTTAMVAHTNVQDDDSSSPRRGARLRRYAIKGITEELTRTMEEALEIRQISGEEYQIAPKAILPPPKPIPLEWYKAITYKTTEETEQRENTLETPKVITEDKVETPKVITEDKVETPKVITEDKPEESPETPRPKRRARWSGQYRPASSSQTRKTQKEAEIKPDKPAAKAIKRAPFVNKRWSY